MTTENAPAEVEPDDRMTLARLIDGAFAPDGKGITLMGGTPLDLADIILGAGWVQRDKQFTQLRGHIFDLGRAYDGVLKQRDDLLVELTDLRAKVAHYDAQVYLFELEYVGADIEGKPRWSRAKTAEVYAANIDDAVAKIEALAGTGPDRGYGWCIRVKAVREVRS